MDILLDSDTGDLDLSSGGLEIAGDSSEVRQRIDLAINLNLGEFFTHVNYGLPWIENTELDITTNTRYFMGEKGSDVASYVAGQLDDYISGMTIVDEFDSEYDFDTSTREFSYSYSVVTTEGAEISFEPYLQLL